MKFLSKKIVALVAGSLAMLGSVSAQAATASTTFNSTATVETACLVSATELAFGSVTPTDAATNVDKTSNVAVTCSNGLQYTITIGFGANGGTEANRFMKNAANADKLAYNIFTDTTRLAAFDAATTNGKVVLNGNGASQITTVYGRLVSNQFVSSGTYSDTLAVNVAY